MLINHSIFVSYYSLKLITPNTYILNTNHFLLFLVILFCLSSCKAGFKEVDGDWAWVDTGAGKSISKLPNVDKATFQIIKTGNKQYAKDKNQVYYLKDVIDGADPESFEIINNQGYTKDNQYVYLDYQKVIHANPKYFELLTFPYAKDNKRIFCGTIPMDVKNINSFKVTETSGVMNYLAVSLFVAKNPSFKWLEKLDVKGVIYGDGKGETDSEKFESFKKVD